MYYYRITKYNPKYRNGKGNYTKEEWTDFSDVGKNFNGKKLTLNEYLVTESHYIESVKSIMALTGVQTLKFINLYKSYDIEKFELETLLSKSVYYSLYEGMRITLDNISDIMKLFLRNAIGGKLVSPNLFIHFGWDYYMYVGTKTNLMPFKNAFLQKSLYLEYKVSPYLNWVDQGKYKFLELSTKNGEQIILDSIKSIIKTNEKLVLGIQNIQFDENRLEILKQMIHSQLPEFKKNICFSV